MIKIKKSGIMLISLAVLYLFSNTQLFCQTNSEVNYLLINSFPQGAQVYINNSLVGTTPYQIVNFGNDIRVKVTLNGVSREQVVGQFKGRYEVFFVMDGDYGLLNTSSAPDSAAVYIDNQFQGLTPLQNEKLTLGSHYLTIKKNDYKTIEKVIYVRPSKYDFIFKMEYNYGFVSIKDNYLNNIMIDDQKAERNNNSAVIIPEGRHTISIQPDNFHRPIDEDFYIESGGHYILKANYNYYTPKYLLYSAVVPGLGQYFDKSEAKGIAYFLGTLISGLMYSNAAKDFDDRNMEVDQLKYQYLNAKDEANAIMYRSLLETGINELNQSAKRKNLYLGTTLGIYLLNIADAVIFHSKGSGLQLEKKVEINTDNGGLGLKIKLN